MGVEAPADPLARGEDALKAGDWEGARAAFLEAIDIQDGPEAHDGLGRALWWLRDVDAAIAEREQAYAAFRKRGNSARAARIAMWLAREYLEAAGNEPASRGWLARAEGLLRDRPDALELGWLALTRGRLAIDPASGRADAQTAVDVGRASGDADLESTGLALLGLALIDAGEVDGGMNHLDEAMAAATGGEVEDQIVFGDVCCIVTRAVEEAGDISRLEKWNEVVMAFMTRSGHAPLLEFCGTCCAEVLLANGQLGEAEGWLTRTLAELEGTGHRARCIHPAAKLAELRLLQGRTEEAERLLGGFEDRPDALRAAAALHLARGETSVAAALLLRRLNQVGDGLLAAPLLALLVEVQVTRADLAAAAGSADRLQAIADRAGQPRLAATASLARGRVAAASGEEIAIELLSSAVAGYSGLEMPLEAARARVELASAVRPADPELAEREARVAFEAADAAGATLLADQAADLLRELGAPARTGPKAFGLLTKREQEVLVLLGEGLSNAEIAARLFISTKTAEHHVSNIFAKLHVRTRTEAVSLALRYPGEISGQR